jgi:hypothetical protein
MDSGFRHQRAQSMLMWWKPLPPASRFKQTQRTLRPSSGLAFRRCCAASVGASSQPGSAEPGAEAGCAGGRRDQEGRSGSPSRNDTGAIARLRPLTSLVGRVISAEMKTGPLTVGGHTPTSAQPNELDPPLSKWILKGTGNVQPGRVRERRIGSSTFRRTSRHHDHRQNDPPLKGSPFPPGLMATRQRPGGASTHYHRR